MHRERMALLLLLTACSPDSGDPTALVSADGVESVASYYHFGDRDSNPTVIGLQPRDLLLAGEGFESLIIRVDLTTIENDDPEVYDIQLVSICSEDASVELHWGGDVLVTDSAQPLPAQACALVSAGETVGYASGLVHFHDIDDASADITLPMNLTFTAPSMPTQGVSHDLDVTSLTIDFDSPT